MKKAIITEEMPDGPKRGHFSRSRSLNDFNAKFSKNIIESTIRKKRLSGNKIRVLEIGCGEGRVLMELKKLFPNIELYGINKKPWDVMQCSESLKETALHYKIFKNEELKNINLPKIYFYDAKKLKFKDDFFDIIISQVSIQYIDRKDILLEEVWRVLKTKGIAFLNVDSRNFIVPDFLYQESPRFVVYEKNKVIPLKTFVKKLRSQGYNLRYDTSFETKRKINRINITIHKNTSKKLKLNLKFDEYSSFDLQVLNPECNKESMYWGYRSVFRNVK